MTATVTIPQWMTDLVDDYLTHDACVHRSLQNIVRDSMLVTLSQLKNRMAEWDTARPDNTDDPHPYAGMRGLLETHQRDERLKELEAALRGREYESPKLKNKVLTDSDA